MYKIDEALFEPLARYLRFRQALPYIQNHKISILDLGCGPKIRFYKFISRQRDVKKYFGFDPLLDQNLVLKNKNSQQMFLKKMPVNKKIPLPNNSVDLVTAFAFFEHIDHPKEILKEAYRIVKPRGRIILTVPSPSAKRFLEFFSSKLGVISSREIQEHKIYFDKELLFDHLPKKVDQNNVFHKYFEFGLNNLMVVTKE